MYVNELGTSSALQSTHRLDESFGDEPNNRGFPASLAVGESELHRVSEPPKSYNNTLQHSNPSSKMKTTDEYKAAVANAIAFKNENPNENATTAARIHHVNAITV
jgi:hypothetical protein